MTVEFFLKKTLASFVRWISVTLPNENWALGGCGDKSNRMPSPHPPALFSGPGGDSTCAIFSDC
jgi:hypothetical protein